MLTVNASCEKDCASCWWNVHQKNQVCVAKPKHVTITKNGEKTNGYMHCKGDSYRRA